VATIDKQMSDTQARVRQLDQFRSALGDVRVVLVLTGPLPELVPHPVEV